MNKTYLSVLLLVFILGGVVWYGARLERSSDVNATIEDQEVNPAVVQDELDAYVVLDDDLAPGQTVVAQARTEEVIVGNLSSLERDSLVFMREEEKLARDVYLALAEMHGVAIFTNIAASEQTHTDAVRELLMRYGVADPVTTDARGVFTNPTFTKLYTELVARGSTSLGEAYQVGAYIEDLDINDLAQQIALTDRDDIMQVYEHLMRGSRNHMRAFNRQVVRSTGSAYVPAFISPDEFTSIITSGVERGSGF